MKLRTKAILVFFTFTVGMVAILYAVSREFLVRRANFMDEFDAQHDMERVMGALDDRLSTLSTVTADWAFWKETCAFVTGQAPHYVEDYLDTGIFVRTVKVNYVVIYDAQRKLVYGKGFDIRRVREMPVPRSFSDLFTEDNVLVRSTGSPTDERHGLLVLPDLEVPLLAASCPILPEDLSGSPLGVVVFAVCADQSFLEEFSHSLRMPVEWHRWAPVLASPMEEVRSVLESSGAFCVTRVFDDHTLSAYSMVPDVYGRPAVIMNVNTPRRIYLEALGILNRFALSFLVTGAVLGPLALFFMQRLALGRLAALERNVTGIGQAADFSRRVAVRGRDEIADLAVNVNRMLDALEEAQRSVRDSENRLRTIVDGAVDGIVTVDEEGRIQSFNEGAERVFGYSEEEILGKNALVLWADPTLPDGLSSSEYISLRSEQAVGASHEGVGRRKDGAIVYLDISVSRADISGKSLYVGIFHDITDRVRAESALRESEGRYRALLSAAPDLMIVLDADGRYQSVHTAQQGLLVRPAEELVGRTIYEVMPEEDARRIHDVVKRTLDSGELQIHEYFLDIEGQRRCFAARTAPFVSEGKSHVLWVARDVTERRRAEDALIAKQRDLEHELAQAAQYVRSLLPAPIEGPVLADWRFISSSALGGDFLHYYWLDDAQFVFYVLDVSGHGVGAALLSVSVHNALRRHTLPNVHFDDPGEVLAALNRAFPMEENDSKFFSIWYGVYDVSTRRLRYAVGGHPPAVLISASQAQTVELGPTDILIGVEPDVVYRVASNDIPRGARIYLFSDGVYEIVKRDGGLMRRADFVGILERVQHVGVSRVGAALDCLYEEHGARVFSDDVSLLEIEFL